jgi:pimeloyl-ACP methyl ester carboxylesterase
MIIMSPMSDFSIKIFFQGCTPVIVYLPGIHGDSSLAQRIRKYFEGKVCFVEFEYSKRTDIELADYANIIEDVLIRNGIKECWLLAESFGSQVAWSIVSKERAFKVKGIILAGGFVRHPFIPGVYIVKVISKLLPIWLIELWLKFYIVMCRLFFRKKKSVEQPVPEQFVRNRLNEADKLAIIARYELIIRNDLRPIAGKTTIPVYFLAGKWDIIVPWQPVLHWLKKNCPGFKGYKILPSADHPVLTVAPEESANQILEWLNA